MNSRPIKYWIWALITLFLGFGVAFSSLNSEEVAAQYTPQAPGDWPMYQHDPAHSGRTDATMVNSGPLYVQWAYSFGERVEIEVQPVVADGIAYVGVMNGDMVAINLSTGTANWVKRPGGPIAHTAAVVNGKVFFGSLDGKVYALDTSTGNTVWSFSTDGPVISAPAVVDGRVFIGSTDGNLYALNENSGAKLWSVKTDGPVVSSPAVRDGKVYFGSEDLKARCVNATSGSLIWVSQLFGAGMHNTHPVISDDGQVAIFVTAKPGLTSYVPVEGYPDSSQAANAVSTWNTFYQAHPKYRTLYYLNTTTGADLWNPTTQRYVPLPLPYWGLLEPVLHPDGSAWFPAPAGTDGHDFILNHDSRLFRVNLSTGETIQWDDGCPVGDSACSTGFQLRGDEVGRHTFSGNDYYYAISEDVGVYRPATKTKRALFSNGDASGYNFGSHMDPHSPLPSRHLWRYGGAVAMGGVPGASAPIVSGNRLYFISYGWLYALGPQDLGKNAATDFVSRDTRAYELTYPHNRVLDPSEIQNEIDQRVADIIALGPNNLPLKARWEQADASGQGLLNNEFSLEVFGFEADLVRSLSEAYPYLSSTRQTQLKNYLAAVVNQYLLDPKFYTEQTVQCIIYDQNGRFENSACQVGGNIDAQWKVKNPNLIAMRFYALWAYANATGNWAQIQANWDGIIWKYFNDYFVNTNFCKPHPTMGFCMFEDWRVGRLNIGAQIAGAQAVRDMAEHLGRSNHQNSAQQLLNRFLDARVAMADFVPSLYQSGQRQPAPIRLNNEVYSPGDEMYDARIYHPDVFGSPSPYNNELIPYHAELRDANTDPSQLNWFYDSTHFQVDAGIGFMYYQALSGFYPLSESLINTLRNNLIPQTNTIVKSYEVNMPWWWLADLAHHTTGSGEHLYTSPTLSWTMFQVKAWVLQEDWNTLAQQLPLPTSFNSKYDLYRLQNLVTLLALPDTPDGPNLQNSSIIAFPTSPQIGDTIQVNSVIQNTGTPSDETAHWQVILPDGLTYTNNTLDSNCGVIDDDEIPELNWRGTLNGSNPCNINFEATVTSSENGIMEISAQINLENASKNLYTLIYIGGTSVFFPLICH